MRTCRSCRRRRGRERLEVPTSLPLQPTALVDLHQLRVEVGERQTATRVGILLGLGQWPGRNPARLMVGDTLALLVSPPTSQTRYSALTGLVEAKPRRLGSTTLPVLLQHRNVIDWGNG